MIVRAVVLDGAGVDNVTTHATGCCAITHLQRACNHLRATCVGECTSDLSLTCAALDDHASTADVVWQSKRAGCTEEQDACVRNVSGAECATAE